MYESRSWFQDMKKSRGKVAVMFPIAAPRVVDTEGKGCLWYAKSVAFA